MSWLARLKTGKAPEKDASKTTETLFVVSVAPTLASFQKNEARTAAGDLPGNDPDDDCWPHSTAMTGAEIDLFTARLHRFADKGLTVTDGEVLADKLVIRDRETDDRSSCLECRHLSGYSDATWRCGNWQAAGIAIRARDTQMPADLALLLQSCAGFTPHLTSTPQGKDDDHN